MNWLSYLTPVTLFKGKTKRNTLVEVREVFGKRKMDLDGYPQSNASYARNWKNIFYTMGVINFQVIGKALVLGLGGGDIAKILGGIRPKWQLTMVEIEPEVVYFAKKYFGITSNPNRNIVVADAKTYMKDSKTKHDLVVIDLYSGDTVPNFVSSNEFLTQVLKSLKKKGMAVFNYASHSFREKDFLSFETKLKMIFPKVIRKVDWGHTFYIVYNDKYDN